jgi:hypothetical protein
VKSTPKEGSSDARQPQGRRSFLVGADGRSAEITGAVALEIVLEGNGGVLRVELAPSTELPTQAAKAVRLLSPNAGLSLQGAGNVLNVFLRPRGQPVLSRRGRRKAAAPSP